jgi:hypothetical protein
MGEVYTARDTRLDRIVAIKTARDSFNERFKREAQSIAALNHPNIVTLYDVGDDYVVMEFVEGPSLRALLDRGVLSRREALDIAAQIADGLAAAHGAGVVHRDVKPENVILSRDGRAKLLDFGIARRAAPEPSDTVTDPGRVMGTAGYMSPEQVRGQEADWRTDIFSLGVVLYEMVAGRNAFTRESSAETMAAIAREEPPELDGSVNPALRQTVGRCLEKNPERRFQSAADLAFALRSIAGGTAEKQAVDARVSRRSLWPMAAGAVAVGIPVAAWVGRRSAPPPPQPSYELLRTRGDNPGPAFFFNEDRSILYRSAAEGEPSRHYAMTLDGAEHREIELPEGASVSAISSRAELAVIVMPQSTLARLPLSGGAPRPVAENARLAAWSPDGARLAVVRVTGGKSLLEYPAGNVLLESDRIVWGCEIDPDGEEVAFFELTTGGLEIASVRGERRRVWYRGPRAFQITSRLHWTAGDKLVFSSPWPGEEGRIQALDASGKRTLLAQLPGEVALEDVSRAGPALVRVSQRRNGMIYRPASQKVEQLLWDGLAGALSADGESFLFSDPEVSGDRVWLRRAGEPQPLLLGEGFGNLLSPDGQWATVTRGEPPKFWLVPVGTGNETELPAAPRAWFSDSRRLLAVKENELFGMNVADRKLVSTGLRGSFFGPVHLSPDERHVLLRVNGQDRIFDLQTRKTRPVAELRQPPIGWTANGQAILIQRFVAPESKFVIESLDLARGQRSPAREIAVPKGYFPSRLIVTPDLRAYAYSFTRRHSQLYLAKGLLA